MTKKKAVDTHTSSDAARPLEIVFKGDVFTVEFWWRQALAGPATIAGPFMLHLYSTIARKKSPMRPF